MHNHKQRLVRGKQVILDDLCSQSMQGINGNVGGVVGAFGQRVAALIAGFGVEAAALW